MHLRGLRVLEELRVGGRMVRGEMVRRVVVNLKNLKYVVVVVGGGKKGRRQGMGLFGIQRE